MMLRVIISFLKLFQVLQLAFVWCLCVYSLSTRAPFLGEPSKAARILEEIMESLVFASKTIVFEEEGWPLRKMWSLGNYSCGLGVSLSFPVYCPAG